MSANPGVDATPAALRHRRPGWRDPRLAVGVAVVAGSVILGAKLVGDADDTVAVWTVSRDLPAGQPLAQADLVARQVRFTDEADADRYLSAEAAAPDQGVLTRDVGEGELLPRAAVGGDADDDLVEVPISAAVDAVPATVVVGSVVDVWVATDPDPTAPAEDNGAQLVLDDVVVVAAPRTEGSLAPSGNRQIIVGVAPDQADTLPSVVAGTARGTVVVTRQG